MLNLFYTKHLRTTNSLTSACALQNKVDMIFKDRENQVGGVKNKDFGAVSQTGLTSV